MYISWTSWQKVVYIYYSSSWLPDELRQRFRWKNENFNLQLDFSWCMLLEHRGKRFFTFTTLVIGLLISWGNFHKEMWKLLLAARLLRMYISWTSWQKLFQIYYSPTGRYLSCLKLRRIHWRWCTAPTHLKLCSTFQIAGWDKVSGSSEMYSNCLVAPHTAERKNKNNW